MWPRFLGSSPSCSRTIIFPILYFRFFKLWKVTHGDTSWFFTFSIRFWNFMSLGQHLLLVFTFYAPWVTFILKHLRFWWLFSLFVCYSLLNFVCYTILSFQHQFELIWMVEFEFLLNPNSNSMGNKFSNALIPCKEWNETLRLMFCSMGFVVSLLWICVCILLKNPIWICLIFRVGNSFLVDFHA